MKFFAFICIIATLIATAFAAFDDINWITSLSAAKAAAADNGKPMAVLITSTNCGACKKLKSTFKSKNQIAEIAEKFNMVHLADGEEPKDAEFAPDGRYFPRLLFADKNGQVLSDVKNARPKHQYFYHDVYSMTSALKSAESQIGN